MKQRNISKSLADIRLSIETIEDFLTECMGERRDFNIYMQNKMLRRAVERELSIIGEATNRIYKVNPEYPILHRRSIIALRNRVVHAYDSLDDPTIWAIIVNHLPLLKAEIDRLLEQK